MLIKADNYWPLKNNLKFIDDFCCNQQKRMMWSITYLSYDNGGSSHHPTFNVSALWRLVFSSFGCEVSENATIKYRDWHTDQVFSSNNVCSSYIRFTSDYRRGQIEPWWRDIFYLFLLVLSSTNCDRVFECSRSKWAKTSRRGEKNWIINPPLPTFAFESF